MPRDDAAAKVAAAPGRVAADEAPSHLRDLDSGPRYRGGIYAWRLGVLRGWAVDLAAPTRAISVAFEAAGERIAETFTGETRPDLAATWPGNVAGFSFDVTRLPERARAALEVAVSQGTPGALVDRPALSLRLDGDGPHIVLGRSGITVRKALAQCRTAPAPPEPELEPESEPAAAPSLAQFIRGHRFLAGIDSLEGATLKGWAIDRLNPRDPVLLQIEADGTPVFGFATGEHRANIGAVLAGNVAGFSVDLAALPTDTVDILAQALASADPSAAPAPQMLALRVKEDDSLIDLAAFGVTAGDLLIALGRAPARLAPPEAAAPVALAPTARDRNARALSWLLSHLGATGPADAPPARRFAAKLLADLETSALVSEPVKQHAREIAPLFDPFHYLEQLERPDEALANPLLHYALAGWRDRLSPNPLFATDYYLRKRGAVAGDPLRDFLREGARRNLDPHPMFDLAFYRKRALEGVDTLNPIAHYLDIGGPRRLDPSPQFDSQAFLDRFDLGPEIEAPLEAYLADRRFADFALSPAFDAQLYRYQIEIERRCRLAEPAYAHYLARGWRDPTLLPNILFDPAFYIERNKLDLQEPALLHYLREGEAAGLACHPHFSPAFYNRERGLESGAGALEHALAHPGLHRSDPRMEAPIDPRIFATVRALIAEAGVEDFRLDIYLDANADLRNQDAAALAQHYRGVGRAEGRLGSLTQMMSSTGLSVRDFPVGFVLADYTSIYPDLNEFKQRFVSALYHYGRFGRTEKRLIGKWQFHIDGLSLDLPSAGAPVRVLRQSERTDVCILIHAFYPDLLPELVGFAQNFREVSFDIFINIVDSAWTPAVQAELYGFRVIDSMSRGFP